MDVYGELLGIVNFSVSNFDDHEKQKEHFTRQRSDYFAAEAVRRGTRDIYSEDEEDYFQTFVDDTYNGIIDIWESDYKTGYERLKNVLVQATLLPPDQCWLGRDTVWINNPQKKGVCHILVNEGRLKGWVKK